METVEKPRKLLDYELNPLHSQKSMVPLEVAPIEQMRFREMPDGSVRFTSDVSLLLNSERIINEIGEANYLYMMRSMNPAKSPYYQGKYSDAQLFYGIKPRYVQTPSEVQAYVDSIVEDGENIRETAAALRQKEIDDAIAKEAAKKANESQVVAKTE